MRNKHSEGVVRTALLKEIDELKKQLPDTDVVKENISNIEGFCPPEDMVLPNLMSYVDLLHRSIPCTSLKL